MSIDLKFRPVSYADFDAPARIARNGMKGPKWQELVRGLRAQGPAWVGGEYLPDLGQGEVEIARITVQFGLDPVITSVLVDELVAVDPALEVCAHGIHVPQHGSSRRPLTLGELVHLIDTVRWGDDDDPVAETDPLELDEDDIDYDQYPWVDGWWWQQWHSGDSAEECTDFARVESDPYPDLEDYYEERAAAWREARERGDGGRRDAR